jgi:dihydroorotase
LDLTRGGVMHEGFVSLDLGLRGMPALAEELHVFRDIELAKLTGGRVHILHVSTAGSVELIRRAKKEGVRVTGEACPHHFLLTDESLRTFDSNYKMAPPLRARSDADAVLAGLLDGTLDVIATDHAPHSPEKKAREFDQCPNGILGVETLLPLCITHLIQPGRLTWPQLIEKVTINPAQVLSLDRGTLKPGAPADVTIIDPEVAWTINTGQFQSKSRNCPFDGWKVKGRAETVIVAGQVKTDGGVSKVH